MGIFNKTEKKANTGLISRKNHLLSRQMVLHVNEGLNGLIWIADGAQKNYFPERKHVSTIDYGDYIIELSFSGAEEPSLIYLSSDVDLDAKYVDELPYYPSYSELTPGQKGMYWKFLANPYDPNFEIGYVFILYYGLERHLLRGNYEAAMNVIIQLRDVHKNASFQSYSGNAIVLTCLMKKRADLVYKFMKSLDNEYEYGFSDNLFLLCKYSLGLPLYAKDIMRLAKAFEFNKTAYIKDYPELFLKTLEQNMIDTFGEPEVLCSQFISKTDFRKLPKEETRIFANISIFDKSIEVPLVKSI